MSTLWNTYAFFVLYANICEFDASKHVLDKASLGAMDRWVLSKMNSMVKAVDENLAAYAVPEAALCRSLWTTFRTGMCAAAVRVLPQRALRRITSTPI